MKPRVSRTERETWETQDHQRHVAGDALARQGPYYRLNPERETEPKQKRNEVGEHEPPPHDAGRKFSARGVKTRVGTRG